MKTIRTRTWGICIGRGILLLLGGCDFLWPTEAPYDPNLCDPRCKTKEVCFEGKCVAATMDGTVPLPDGKADVGVVPDGSQKDTGDRPSKDVFTPDKQRPDQMLPDQTIPDQAVPDQVLPDQAVPDQVLPDQAIPDQAVPDQVLPDQAVPDSGVLIPGTWNTIQPGTFQMGSPDGSGPQSKEPCRSSKETPHQVKLTGKFEMQTTEVNQAQFKAVMGYSHG